MKKNQTLMFCLAFYLVLIFLWRLFSTANEYDSVEMVWFSIGFDVLCLVALVATRIQLTQSVEGQPLSPVGQVMFFVALGAGIGLLAIRLNGDASWWTGHVNYDCCPPR
jgi:membrane protease YdiL (CAAX protease family)